MVTKILNKLSDTEALACAMAKDIRPGDILLLKGDLGSGKTTFTQFLLKVIGVEKTVTSPTFVIMKKYETAIGQVREVYHLDCYRLDGSTDVEAIGLPEIIGKNDSLVVIEWPEKIGDFVDQFQPRLRKMEFSYLDSNSRKVSYDPIS